MPHRLNRRRVARALLACWVLTSFACSDGRQDDGGPTNLVLVSLDTLRADHLGCYGHDRPTSPNIDALASRSTRFRNAFSTAPKTAESHMSMFTSLYPTAHGVSTLREAAPGDEIATPGPGVRTLAQMLKERGYATAGFHNNAFVDAKFGFDRGFDVYEKTKLGPALRWLEDNADSGPFFLFFHTYHVHDPYTPRPPWDERFAGGYDGRIVHDLIELERLAGTEDWDSVSKKFWSLVDKDDTRDVAHLRALYDAEIAEIDASVQRLIELVDRIAPNTLFVLVSDHGEEFGEHGRFLHQQVYDELLRVPWIVRLPGQTTERVVDEPVSTIDLAPTLLDLLSIPGDEQFQGRTLRPLIEAAARPASPAREAAHVIGLRAAHADVAPSPSGARAVAEPVRYIFSELPMWRLAALRDARWKLVVKGDVVELYDHVADPRERLNLLSDPTQAARADVREAAERLRSALDQRLAHDRELHARNAAGAPRRKLDADVVEEMRALGYID